MTTTDMAATGRNRWTMVLWVVQVLLALAFGAAGMMKLGMPIDTLAAQMAWVNSAPELLVRFIGLAEVAGALGMILPAAARILPWLTPLAALGFVVIQVLAIITHALLGELLMVLPVNLVLLGLAALVAWGRWRIAPIVPRR